MDTSDSSFQLVVYAGDSSSRFIFQPLANQRDYLAEQASYSDERWEAPQRAARLAEAVKRYKTYEMLHFIFATIAYDPDPDLTPLAVKRLCNALFGRTDSQWLIVEVFGAKGRQH